MSVSLLPDRLRLLRFPREDLELCSHAILKQILFRDYSHSNRQRHREPLFSFIDNSLEISIFGDCDAISRDFPKDLCPGLEVSSHIYRALQVDNDDTFNSSRICSIVEPLANAGVSIFYMSTYQTDLLFVQENRLPVVFSTLSKNGLDVHREENVECTPPDSPIQEQRNQYGIHVIPEDDAEEELDLGHPRHPLHGQYHYDHNTLVDSPDARELSLASPPNSMDSISDQEPESDRGEEIQPSYASQSSKQPLSLDILSAQSIAHRGHDSAAWTHEEQQFEERILSQASPATATAFELRQQAIRTLPENYLRCVGLNTELEAGHQPWILKVIKILFYHDKVKEKAIQAGRRPEHDAPRFFSFTVTSECVSMITDVYILQEFEEYELFMDMDTCPLRLIQLDLHRFGLDKYGIIHSVARPLTEAGIELLYLSTFSTANILVMEHRLIDAEKILSGSGSSTPTTALSVCAEEAQSESE
ncbi:hypothetical protein CPC16_007691 [Podila verticillata]|nr:hypothetical protein CPC16_007691 [Podila verticillata]